jgi:hypothetical protein
MVPEPPDLNTPHDDSGQSFDRKFDRNPNNHQRTTTNVDRHKPALQDAGRTARNIYEHSWPYLSIGISAFLASTIVHLPLHRPIECPWVSAEMCCCPPVLLSVLGSPATYVIQTIEESRNYPLTGFGRKLVGDEVAEAFQNHETCVRTSFAIRSNW